MEYSTLWPSFISDNKRTKLYFTTIQNIYELLDLVTFLSKTLPRRDRRLGILHNLKGPIRNKFALGRNFDCGASSFRHFKIKITLFLIGVKS